MKPYVICIDREYGSGGRMVGQKVAQSLEIPFYDNQLMDLSPRKAGWPMKPCRIWRNALR